MMSISRLRLFGAIAMICVTGLLVAAAFDLGRSTPPLRLVSVQILSDRLEPLEGAVVRLTTATSEVVTLADMYGQTPWVAMDFESGLELMLVEKTLREGLVLGMLEHLVQPPGSELGSMEHELWRISRTQPFAVPVAVAGDPEECVNLWPPEGEHPHWSIVVAPGSPLRFGMHVASLLDRDAVRQYLAYRGHVPEPESRYVCGVVLIVSSLHLGDQGFGVVLDLLSELTEGVEVDAYSFGVTEEGARESEKLAIELVDVFHGSAVVRVFGKSRGGHIALLARPHSGLPSQVFVLDDGAPSIETSEGGGGTSRTNRKECIGCPAANTHSMGNSSDAETPDLRHSKCCDPIAPKFTSSPCELIPPPDALEGSAAGRVESTILRTRLPRWCSAPGVAVDKLIAITGVWKCTYRLSGEVIMDTVKLQSSDGFEYGKNSEFIVTSRTMIRDGAHGAGQCVSRYFSDIVYMQRFSLCCGGPIWSGEMWRWDRCLLMRDIATLCLDAIDSSSICDRRP